VALSFLSLVTALTSFWIFSTQQPVATKQEPAYPDVVLATESPPWDGPFPYSSSQDPSLVLPLFYLEVSPEDWDRYERWWRSAVGLDGSKVLVRFGTNQVLIQDAVTLRPAEWLTDNILHYFTHSVKRTFKIKNSVLVILFFLLLDPLVQRRSLQPGFGK
jgi:hypothetical protein